MTTRKYRLPVADVAQDLMMVSADVGLTELEIVNLLLGAGLTIENLLDYVEAVTTKRVN